MNETDKVNDGLVLLIGAIVIFLIFAYCGMKFEEMYFPYQMPMEMV